MARAWATGAWKVGAWAGTAWADDGTPSVSPAGGSAGPAAALQAYLSDLRDEDEEVLTFIRKFLGVG